MNSEMLREIENDEVDTYHRDGVVMLPQMFDRDWIELLQRGLVSLKFLYYFVS